MRPRLLAVSSPIGRSLLGFFSLGCVLLCFFFPGLTALRGLGAWGGGSAHADLSPRLRMVARGQLSARLVATPADPSRALVTVRVAGGAAHLGSLGFAARSLGGDTAALTLDAATLVALAQLAPEAHVEERRVLVPQLDRATATLGLPGARDAAGLSGAGVLVGVIDTGADFRHADLRTATGATRIAALLDQRVPADARHVGLGDFGGAIWLRDELDAVLLAEAAMQPSPQPVDSKDVNGHGTHVASIATSTGLATGEGLPAGRYVGVAPGAELLIVQASSTTGGFTDVGVLAGCRFAVERARALGRPLVVNVSLGGSGGAHDGSTNVERALDDLFPATQPGLALVVSAGNSGSDDLHAGGWALDGEATLPLQVGGSPGGLGLELWYRGDLAIAIEAPSGHRSPRVPPGGTIDWAFPDEGRVAIDNGSRGASPNGRTGAGVVIAGVAESGPIAGAWKIIVAGRSIRYDAWLLDSPALAVSRFTGSIVTDGRVVVPAAARNAIAVGSVISRLDWVTHDGAPYSPSVDPTRTGGPSSFSATGPTTDGRFSPDVSAPGEFVIAAMSRDATPDVVGSVFHGVGAEEALQWSDDGQHGVLRGTSQAAPMVAGVIALLLEADPTLTGDAIRELLRVTARNVPGTAGWSPRAGFGRVDPAAAIAYLRGGRGDRPSATRSVAGVTRDLLPPGSEETTLVTVTPRDESDRPLGPGHAVTIQLSAGDPLGAVVDTGTGRYERSFVAHAARGAVGVARITVDGVLINAAPQVFFVPSRAEVGQRFVAGGGCEMGGGEEGSPGLAVLAVLVALGLGAVRTRSLCRCKRRSRGSQAEILHSISCSHFAL